MTGAGMNHSLSRSQPITAASGRAFQHSESTFVSRRKKLICAAAVNRPDILQRKGAYNPPPGTSDKIYRGDYAAVPHMTFVRADNSLHFIMLDQPAQLDAALNAFLMQ